MWQIKTAALHFTEALSRHERRRTVRTSGPRLSETAFFKLHYSLKVYQSLTGLGSVEIPETQGALHYPYLNNCVGFVKEVQMIGSPERETVLLNLHNSP